MTEREKSYAGFLYQPADPELSADRDITVQKLYEYNQIHPLDRSARQAAIKELLGSVGEDCTVEQPLFCTLRVQHHPGRPCISECQLPSDGQRKNHHRKQRVRGA